MIGGYGMSEEQRLKTITGLSELWDGKRGSRVRSGEGAMLLYGKRLSMHLMIQPIVAQPVLSDSLLIQQGVLARFLNTWPESTAGQRPYEPVDLSCDPDLERYRKRISEIINLPLPLNDGKRNELKPKPLSLSGAAKTLWIKFHDTIERQLPDGKALAPIRAFANKAPQHAQRLAGTITTIDNVEAETVSIDQIGAGIDLVQFYISESLRLYNSSLLNPNLLLAQKLLTWAQQFDYVYLQKIYQFGPNAIREAETAKRIVRILEGHGWFIRVTSGIELDGAIVNWRA